MKRHRMVVGGIQHVEYEHGPGETHVLWRCGCGCGKARTQVIDGLWTLAQLGLSAAPSA